MPPRVRRLLFIVSRAHPDLYDSLTRTFAGDDTVQVILDRRLGERRRRPGARRRERRRGERRLTDIAAELRARGHAIVGVLVDQRRRAPAGPR